MGAGDAEAVWEVNEVDKMVIDVEDNDNDNSNDSGAADNTSSPHKRHGRAHAKDGRPKKPKAESKLAIVVRRWLANVLPTLPGMPLSAGSSLLEWSVETLVAQAPKRWVVYEPMVLLPTGSFGFSAATILSPKRSSPISSPASPRSPRSPTAPAPPLWQTVFASVSCEQQDQLWRDILLALSPKSGSSGANNAQLTHLAVNEGIPLMDSSEEAGGDENILRSPTGLRPLYGDFGPATTEAGGPPTDADFKRAFWVSTKQNGLYQTWAPRWSMFSRGNIKEKARLLAWQTTAQEKSGWAVDLYAGIGYFVFSYAQRGLRVLGWELNPWSAEALRRGAARNGWSVRVVRGDVDLGRPTADVVFSGMSAEEEEEREQADDTENTEGEFDDDDDDEPPPIIIFVEDNQHAARRLAELQTAAAAEVAPSPALSLGPVVHVNCGLLPTSRPTWRIAWDAVVGGNLQEGTATPTGPRTGWLHLHDNVGVEELASRQAEIQTLVTAWAGEVAAARRSACTAMVEHVEQVKTFAPGVWHCVFDVRITL
ncbi:S-adenosylmethionine-dependent methyltransferase [Sporothrix bragantina]|uniref:tRNA(Phe) (4-demethylwyosine(37)-C(7)) aminocarboxypropyltransferase n=1 Tax=Sporothrix bragantina TaxID=671064 RepID=A0ABP0CN26_9PEZI